MNNGKMSPAFIASIIVAVLGAAKLILQAFNIDIPNVDANDVSNVVAGVFSVIGPIVALFKHRKVVKSVVTPPVVTPPSSK